MTEPLRFAFGVHLHQPVGNFDSVFEQHLTDVYRPLVGALRNGGFLPISLHLSGPLLDWMERRAPDWLDEIGTLAADGQMELLASGYDEPILAMLSRADRLEQVGRMRESLRHRFGVTATGLWLTERVWEPDLAADLAEAGIGYTLVDDRHFLVAGHQRAELHRPWLTEGDGHRLSLLAIDEKLRYLIPFRPPEELAEYLRTLRAAGQPLAVLGDDGEKFGGWPGTREWVYRDGWMERFLATMRSLVEGGEVRLVTMAEAVAEVPSAGPCYLPSASYREMEGWALPTTGAAALTRLEAELGDERMGGTEGALVRGTHWRNFLVKYPEANRLHKKMLLLSRLCRKRGEPAEARRAIGRAQCNDAYWHGVFGGLYLPFLRGALWGQLALAEAALRRGEALRAEVLDIDWDGGEEIWVHDAAHSIVIAPMRGGAIEEWTDFAAGVNLAAVLTRRREAYHLEAMAAGSREAGDDTHGDDAGTATIHDIEANLRLDALPPIDALPRGLGVDRVLPAGATVEGFINGTEQPVVTWQGRTPSVEVMEHADRIEVRLAWPELTKVVTVRAGGGAEVSWEWDPAQWAEGWFSSEWSWFAEHPMETDGERWSYPVETVAKSERGLDRTVQGEAVVVRWPAAAGRGWVRV